MKIMVNSSPISAIPRESKRILIKIQVLSTERRKSLYKKKRDFSVDYEP